MKLLIRWVITSLALFAAAWLVPGIHVEGNAWIVYAVMAVILGLVNAIVRPVLKFLTRWACSPWSSMASRYGWPRRLPKSGSASTSSWTASGPPSWARSSSASSPSSCRRWSRKTSRFARGYTTVTKPKRYRNVYATLKMPILGYTKAV